MQPVSMPPFWETLLQGYVKRVFYADTRRKKFADRAKFTEGDYRFFVRGVQALSHAFTQERHNLPKNYLNKKEMRSGYILYFLPVNALKVAALLSQLPQDQLMTAEGGRIRVIDVGSGPGTGMLGTFHYLETLMKRRTKGRLELEWVLVDQNRQALSDAAELHDLTWEHTRRRNPGWEILSRTRLVEGNLFSDRLNRILEPQGASLVLALNVLSELPRAKRVPVVEGILKDFLNERGRLLVMEPALRLTSRDLMQLRDEVLLKGSISVHSPCLHQADCPMLKANNRDWCHTYIPWERPAWIEKIDRLAAIRKDYLKCAFLFLGQEPPPPVPSNIWRVVSGPLNSKGETERLLCGEAGLPGLLRVMMLDRDSWAPNADFGRLERGDLVEISKTARVGRETKVRRL